MWNIAVACNMWQFRGALTEFALLHHSWYLGESDVDKYIPIRSVDDKLLRTRATADTKNQPVVLTPAADTKFSPTDRGTSFLLSFHWPMLGLPEILFHATEFALPALLAYPTLNFDGEVKNPAPGSLELHSHAGCPFSFHSQLPILPWVWLDAAFAARRLFTSPSV